MSTEQYDAVDIIRAQRDGRAISEGEIRWLVDAYTRGYVMDAQMSAFTMAVLLNGLGRDQIRVLTDAMIASGERMDFSSLDKPTVDKHSTGGVGDKITLPLAPLVARFRRGGSAALRPRSRAHGWHSRQTRVDPGVARRAVERRDPRAARRRRCRDLRRGTGSPRPTRSSTRSAMSPAPSRRSR